MTSIFPNGEAGGLIIRDPETGAPVEQPEVYNAEYPVQLNINCDLTALPSTCDARVAPEQINAIVSELINFYVAMAPAREWDCSELDNLASAFEEFVQNLGSEGGGPASCSLTIGNAGETGDAYLLYCSGSSMQRWSIHAEGGLVEFIFDTLCQVPTSNVADGDYILYCRDGEMGKGQALFLNLYTGTWLQNRTYSTKNMVQKDGKLYSPNAPIPQGTPFTIGTTGATWYEVSPTMFPSFDPDLAYSKDTIISYIGKFWAANDDVPASTPFTVGTTGPTWREIDFANISILDFAENKTYRKYNVVKLGNNLYRASQDVNPGSFNPAQWELLTIGDRSKYRGTYVQTQAYLAEDMVVRNGILYAANNAIAANANFSVGTTGATWRIVSDNSIEWAPTKAYPSNELVSYQGALFMANGAVPVGIAPAPPNIGTATGTWRAYALPITVVDYSPIKAYMPNELFLRPNPSFPNEKQLWAAGAGPYPAAFDPKVNVLIGERNKFRGKWSNSDTYKVGDVVFRDGITDAYGTMFEANSNIDAGSGFTIGAINGTWKKVGPTGGFANLRIWDQNGAYKSGEMVLTPWGIYVANADITAGAAFRDGPDNFEPYNSGRRPIISLPGDADVIRNHRNATVIFETTTLTRTYKFVGDVGFNPGDTIFVMTRGSQMVIAPSAAHVVRSVYGLTSVAQPYASVVLRCIGKTSGVCEWLLTGDLQVI